MTPPWRRSPYASVLPLPCVPRSGDRRFFTACMAEGNGLAALAELGIPIVLMVGQPTPRLLDRARAAGVTRVVEKPLLGGMLSDAVKHALDDVASQTRGPVCC